MTKNRYQRGTGEKKRRAPRSNSAQSKVLTVIATKPGQRGVDVVQTLIANGTPVEERTVRTALNRLRNSGHIIQKEGAWFPIQSH